MSRILKPVSIDTALEHFRARIGHNPNRVKSFRKLEIWIYFQLGHVTSTWSTLWRIKLSLCGMRVLVFNCRIGRQIKTPVEIRQVLRVSDTGGLPCPKSLRSHGEHGEPLCSPYMRVATISYLRLRLFTLIRALIYLFRLVTGVILIEFGACPIALRETCGILLQDASRIVISTRRPTRCSRIRRPTRASGLSVYKLATAGHLFTSNRILVPHTCTLPPSSSFKRP
ncbi:hypothetical protein PGTUg99_021924 [Puccinia graminis f. sp. tritici]|uniref:Uncharacterized protein n=1 Tax=Puccinia graminis f. sp. tritici TaxID=56615 RepID=A0A5B0M7X9_PUCGR|nr:hypothetical protein PGTUg99_021924 [Puccinia graminis f. sp. tritici]